MYDSFTSLLLLPLLSFSFPANRIISHWLPHGQLLALLFATHHVRLLRLQDVNMSIYTCKPRSVCATIPKGYPHAIWLFPSFKISAAFTIRHSPLDMPHATLTFTNVNTQCY
ncbi:hypothetical protein IQ06DRAFT_69687 [Phaeosphaeriaceae sp. SRC1lsM3a]|nr:hypothetical protein IQ06DRAFT_69687 [Stagonospora sp. SRC1lsM3a]